MREDTLSYHSSAPSAAHAACSRARHQQPCSHRCPPGPCAADQSPAAQATHQRESDQLQRLHHVPFLPTTTPPPPPPPPPYTPTQVTASMALHHLQIAPARYFEQPYYGKQLARIPAWKALCILAHTLAQKAFHCCNDTPCGIVFGTAHHKCYSSSRDCQAVLAVQAKTSSTREECPNSTRSTLQ